MEKNDKLLDLIEHKQCKHHSSVQKVVSTVFFFLVYRFIALAFLLNIPFLFNNSIYFISDRFFHKTREKLNREKTVRVGRSVVAFIRRLIFLTPFLKRA